MCERVIECVFQPACKHLCVFLTKRMCECHTRVFAWFHTWDLQDQRGLMWVKTSFYRRQGAVRTAKWEDHVWFFVFHSPSSSLSLFLFCILVWPSQPFTFTRSPANLSLLIPSPGLRLPLPPFSSVPSLFLLSLSLLGSNWNWQLWESWHTPATGSWLERNYEREKKDKRQRERIWTGFKGGLSVLILHFGCFIAQGWRVSSDESLACLYLHVILWQIYI